MERNKLYDVAVAGGGLAGLCLAIQFAKSGYSVALFEKEEYPYHKVCGEYISMESWDFLQRLGMKLYEMNLPVIKELQISDAKGRSYDFDLPLGGFGISRYALDNALHEIAKAQGVHVFTKSKVSNVSYADGVFTITAHDTMQAKVVAGCFGKRSNLDVKWKRPFTLQKAGALNNYIGIKYHIRHEHEADKIFLHNFRDGYCGISRIEEGKSCLCYLTTAQNLRSCNNSIAEMERQVLFKNPKLEAIFSNSTFLYKEPLTISQISFNKKLQVEEHLLMLGDAAGMITPLCGNGMSMAMHASKIASSVIAQFLDGAITRTEMEDAYTAEWKKNFSTRLKVGRMVQRFFGGNFSTSLLLKILHVFPALSKTIISLTHGKPF